MTTTTTSMCHLSGANYRAKRWRLLSIRQICLIAIVVLFSSQLVACQETTTPSQSFISSSGGGAQELASSRSVKPKREHQLGEQLISGGGGGSLLVVSRQSKQAEEEDGFIMKTHQSQLFKQQQDEEVVSTTQQQLSLEQVTTMMPIPSEQLISDDRIAINASREQFLTHDQLLNANTKDEQIQVQQQQLPTPTSQPRFAMPRFAYASSILTDFLFGSRHISPPQLATQYNQHQAVTTSITTTPTPLITTTSKPQDLQQQQHTCPGVCLNILVASLRCQHAIAAPCPSLLQKCCEMDDVSLNGTPVETSAPFSNGGDTDSSSSSSTPIVSSTARPFDSDEQTPTPAINRFKQQTISTLPEQQQQQQQQVPSSLSSDSTIQQSLDDHNTHNSRSVYFLSSSSGDTANAHAAPASEPQKRLEQQQTSPQLWQQQPPTHRPHNNQEHEQPNIAQHAGVGQSRRPNTTTAAASSEQPNGNNKPAQSFDSPHHQQTTTASAPAPINLSTFTSQSASATLRDRLVLIQTANGTTYLQHSSDPARKPPPPNQQLVRPLYANWTDYQLLMMQSRPPTTNNNSTPLYHSNLDPVRMYAGVVHDNNDLSSMTGSPSQPLHQNLSQPVAQRLRPHNNANDQAQEEPLKVLKDQHSSSRDTTEISTTPITPTPTPTTTPEVTVTETLAQAEERPQDIVDAEQQQLSMPVSGIANFLGSLFDTFISSAPSEGVGVAADQQPPTQVDEISATEDQQQQQHNDRRLGLDLSFRQPNDLNGGNASGQPEVDNYHEQGDQRCQGYCSLEAFLHLCDSHYSSSDCARSQKCCVTATAAEQSPAYATTTTTTSTSTRQQQQQQSAVCHGACLPIYHSSLCLKPNEILLDSPSCLPNQFCCSHQTQSINQLMDSENNYLDGAEMVASGGDQAHTSSTTTTANSGNDRQVTDGSISKDHSLTVSLVPPPPPTINALPTQQQQQQSISGRHVMQSTGGYTLPVAPNTNYQQQLQANRPIAVQQQQQQNGGIMNQLFQMFKSNTGLGKQKPKASPPTQIAPSSYQQQQHIVYELTPNYHQMVGSSRPSAAASNNVAQVVSFPSPTNPTNGVAPILIGPNGQQAFVGPPVAHRQQQQLINGFTLEQMAQLYQTDASQFASLLQKQFGTTPQMPNRPQQLAMGNYQPIEQQQQQLMNSMASGQQQQQQHKVMVSNYAQPQQQSHQRNQQISPQTFAQNNNQPTRWTHLNDNNNNAQAPVRQQPQVAYSQQQRINQRPVSGGGGGGGAQFAFGPADAAINNVQQDTTIIRQQQQQLTNKPLASTAQQFGWTGTNARPEPQTNNANNNRPAKVSPTPDANIVVPVVQPQSQQRPSHNTQQQQQQVSNWNTGSGGGLKLSPLPAGTSQTMPTTSAPSGVTRPNKLPANQQLASAASYLNPVHSLETGSDEPNNTDELPAATPSVSTADDAAAEAVAEQPVEQQQQCKSACLAYVLSFNCLHPNYIDPNLTCHTPGTVCCVKATISSVSTSMSTASATPTISTTPPPPPTQSDDELKTSAVGLGEIVPADVDQSDLMVGRISTPTPSVNILEAAVEPQQQQQQSSTNPIGSATSTRVTTACGLPGPSRSSSGLARRGRVMGGSDAAPGYWCWQAALMNGKNEYLCGGALIGTKWVLTAAHCVTQHLRSENQLFVRLGQWNLNSSSPLERRSARSVLVKTSYVHHNHNGVTLDNDIALLRLEDSVDLSEPAICTVCLPERQQQLALEAGKRCTVTGYGFDTEQGPAALRVRQTELPIVGDLECQNKTSQVLAKPFVLPASSFCAGGELGRDACHGDGGSPLACLVDGAYELTGIVSWGYKCGNKDLPGLYAKVSNFVGWINQIVSVNS